MRIRACVEACARPVRLLLLGEMLSLLASAVGQAGMAWWIGQAGGAADLARYGAWLALCSLLATPLMSPWGDRQCKRRLIRLGKLCLLLDGAALALLAANGSYRLPWLCACSALSILANAAWMPAQASLLPDWVAPERLPDALRLRRGAQALGGLMGPGLGGAALAAGGVPAAMGLSLLWLGVAALAACRLGEPPGQAPRVVATGWCADLAAGLRAKWSVPLDRWWTLAGALMMVFLLPAIGMLVPLRVHALGLSARWFGACGAALSLGLLVGVAGVADAGVRRLGRWWAMWVAVGTCGLAVGAAGLCHWAPGLVLLHALMGLCMSVTQRVGQTHRMLAIPQDFRARMAAAQLMAAQVSAALAPLLAGALLQRWPVETVYLVLSAGFLLSSLLLLAVPGLPSFLLLDHGSVTNWYGRHHPQVFARPRRAPALTPCAAPPTHTAESPPGC